MVRRVLVSVSVLAALFSGAIGIILPGPPSPALIVGIVFQLSATALVALASPHLGVIAVTIVAAGMVAGPAPWPGLFDLGATAWIPITLAWSVVRAVEHARTPLQLWLCGLFTIGYVGVVGTERGPVQAAGSVLPILGAVTIAYALRLRRARQDQLVALDQARRGSDRDRLAAQIHDTLGHHLTLMVLRANSFALTANDPAGRETGRQLAAFGTAALADLRGLVTAVRTPASDTPQGMHAAALEELVADGRAAGQRITFTVSGEPAEFSPAILRAVHRVIQEGLTNARKHAPGSTAAVEVVIGDDVVVAVSNDGAVAGQSPAAAGDGEPSAHGTGLSALRRRIEILDGELDARPTAAGYAVRVRLPKRTEK
ncbi:histidine kinase [Kribbella sp. NPDC056861]|uniref:sensor histidine kinase n=1 Tax=Kribbella sp. NPDC056861 TaxID=3154857 RepID=UPI00341B7B43